MRNLFRNCIYQGKNLLRDAGFSFWSLIYPLIMAVFFYMTLSGVLDFQLENINVGIDSENPISYILEDIDFVNVHKVPEDEVLKKLDSEDRPRFYRHSDLPPKPIASKEAIERPVGRLSVFRVTKIQR